MTINLKMYGTYIPHQKFDSKMKMKIQRFHIKDVENIYFT